MASKCFFSSVLLLHFSTFTSMITTTISSPHSSYVHPSGSTDSALIFLSSCPFQRDGILRNLSVNLNSEFIPNDLQIWRPTSAIEYKLRWSALRNSVAVHRRNAQVECDIKLGVIVKRGDVVGVLVPHRQLGYSVSGGNTSGGSVAYHKMEGAVLPTFLSDCGGRRNIVKLERNSSITYEFQAEDDYYSAGAVSSVQFLSCGLGELPDCENRQARPARVRRQTLATQTTGMMNMTQTALPSPANLTSTVAMTTTGEGGDRESDSSAGTSEDSSPLSLAAIAVVIVSVVLLILLVVLLFVLIGCVCSKKSVKKTFVPTTAVPQGDTVTNESTSNLAASQSVEHSNSSSNSATSPTAGRPLSQQTTSTHAYVNAEITQFGGAFRPFTPLYVNSDDESMREVLSDRGSHFGSRTREGRGWSVVSSRSQIDRVQNFAHHHGNHMSHPSSHQLRESQRQRRAKSASATTHFKVDTPLGSLPRPNTYANNLSSVLTKPLPPLPSDAGPSLAACHVVRSQPQLTTFNLPPPTHSPPPPADSPTSELVGISEQCLYPEVSGDYTSPVPVSERYKYEPNPWPRTMSGEMVEVISVGGRQPVCGDQCHDYSDPDEPDQESQMSVFQYDHLSEDFHPETSPSSRLSGFNPDKEESLPSFGYSYGYVPTEEQRRMMQLQNGGHYEMADDIEKSQVLGYDHLNYFHEADTYWIPAATAEDLYTQLAENKYREIFRHELSIHNSIGAGHFGSVSKGVWFNGCSPVDVAIKTMKGTDEQERVKLLQEAAIMGQFAHNNVVRLHGVVTMGEPVLVVLEYMEKGDLRSFLQKLHPKMSKRELPTVVPSLFVKFSKDIANGMGYLAKKCFIHRDLAARNILLSEKLTCKIGDFGMARDVENEGDYYRSHGGMIPVKWTAPEALHYNKYSSASDVWSYGMVLFEIWSLGEKPYSDFSNPIVIALVSSKHCQPPPPGCPRPIYHLMVECWNPEHACRPTFDSIYDYLDSPDESLLQWPQECRLKDHADRTSGVEGRKLGVHNLGAPLEQAENLYLELQRTYQNPPPEIRH